MSPAIIRFTAVQRAELLRLGVPEEAFHFLEGDALPGGRRLLEKKATRNQILSQLERINRDLAKAQGTIQALFDANRNDPRMAALVAARGLLNASQPRAGGGIPLRRTHAHLRWSRMRIERALKLLPAEPVRHQTASPWPVEMIHRALHLGARAAGLPDLPPHLRPSVAPKSKFHAVVCVCYEAMTSQTSDPDRAVRAYVKVWRQECRAILLTPNVQNVASDE